MLSIGAALATGVMGGIELGKELKGVFIGEVRKSSSTNRASALLLVFFICRVSYNFPS